MEEFYNVRQVANLLGIKVRTVREWIHKGKIIAQKYEVSKRWYVSESEIRRIRNDNKD